MKLRSYVVLSDLHIGARNTTAKEIIDHLQVFFEDFSPKSWAKDLDVIFIAGDLWDDTVSFSDSAIKYFIPFFTLLINFCKRNKISLIVLEGTPKHDRKQSETLKTLAQAIDPSFDFVYVDELSIRYVPKLDMNVLFVPDECRTTSLEVERDVEAMMSEKGLTQVDIAIMHGMFNYQLGTIPHSERVYSEQWFLKHVKRYINIGHIHKASQYERILAQGSFDRLTHGEEDPKGAYLLVEEHGGDWAPIFIENKCAKKYISINAGPTAEKTIELIKKAINKGLPEFSHIRLVGEPTLDVFKGFEELRKQFPQYQLTKKVSKEISVEETKPMMQYQAVVLNRETISEVVFNEVSRTNDFSPSEGKRLFELLESLHE